ncbi:hypothetical protein ACLOJK_026059 [Asimina triloba]
MDASNRNSRGFATDGFQIAEKEATLVRMINKQATLRADTKYLQRDWVNLASRETGNGTNGRMNVLDCLLDTMTIREMKVDANKKTLKAKSTTNTLEGDGRGGGGCFNGGSDSAAASLAGFSVVEDMITGGI